MRRRLLIGLRPGERTGLGTPGVADLSIAGIGGLLLARAARSGGRLRPLLAAGGIGLLYRGLSGGGPLGRLVDQGPRERDPRIVERTETLARRVRSTTVSAPLETVRGRLADPDFVAAVVRSVHLGLGPLPGPAVRVTGAAGDLVHWTMGIGETPVALEVRAMRDPEACEVVATIGSRSRTTRVSAGALTAILSAARQTMEAGAPPTVDGQPSGARRPDASDRDRPDGGDR